MARKKRLDLATAKVADGQLMAGASVYSLVGITDSRYKHKSLASYSKMLNGMDLIELQDHAYEVGTLAGSDRHSLIERLERKFIEESRKFGATAAQPEDPSLDATEDLREQAKKIVSRGR